MLETIATAHSINDLKIRLSPQIPGVFCIRKQDYEYDDHGNAPLPPPHSHSNNGDRSVWLWCAMTIEDATIRNKFAPEFNEVYCNSDWLSGMNMELASSRTADFRELGMPWAPKHNLRHIIGEL